jgi:hypothetical protein
LLEAVVLALFVLLPPSRGEELRCLRIHQGATPLPLEGNWLVVESSGSGGAGGGGSGIGGGDGGGDGLAATAASSSIASFALLIRNFKTK